jgi:HEPN domain-containing protein
MISFQELKKISRTRIKDAKILLNNNSYDGSLYLCGYAVEIALKAIICKHLNIGGTDSVSHIPSNKQEFKIIEQIKTHSLETLLDLTPTNISIEIKSNSRRFADWSTILKWNPEMRYAPIRGKQIKRESFEGIDSAQRILRYLWKQI